MVFPKYIVENLQEIEQNFELPLKVCEQIWDSTNERLLKNHNRILLNN